MPTAPRQWGSALQELHCPLPPGSEAVHCRSHTVHCPQAVRQCIAGVAMPTAPGQCGSVLQEVHCPLPQGSEAVHCGSALIRLCNNTLTHSAHATHTAQPVYLCPWVDIPAFCHLVTAPSAHHTTPHHTTPHHTTPHRTAPHHTTPHHTTPHHTTPHHTTPHHTTPHHSLVWPVIPIAGLASAAPRLPLSGPAPRTHRPSCISGASPLDGPAVTLQTASCGWMEQRGWRRLSMEGRTMDT